MRRAIAHRLFPLPVLLVVTVLFSCAVASETASQTVGSMRVTTPSPTVASLGRFGDYPTGKETILMSRYRE